MVHSKTIRYWLRAKTAGAHWRLVTPEAFKEAERQAGFRKPPAVPGDGPATAGFSGARTEGRVTDEDITEAYYGWDPEFLADARAEFAAALG